MTVIDDSWGTGKTKYKIGIKKTFYLMTKILSSAVVIFSAAVGVELGVILPVNCKFICGSTPTYSEKT